MKNKTTLYQRIIVVSLFFILSIILEIYLLNIGFPGMACNLHLVILACMILLLSLKKDLNDLVINHSLLFLLHISYILVLAVFGFDRFVIYKASNWFSGFYRFSYTITIVGSLLAIIISAFIQISIKVIIYAIKQRKETKKK